MYKILDSFLQIMNLDMLCFYKFVYFIFAVGSSIYLCCKDARKTLNRQDIPRNDIKDSLNI